MEMVTSSQPSLSNCHERLVSEHKSSSEIWHAVSEQPLNGVQMFVSSSGGELTTTELDCDW